MKTVLRYLSSYIGRMTVGYIIKTVGTVMDLFLPWILSYIIDDLIPLGHLEPIFFWGVMMLICSAIALAGNVIANRMAAAVARDTTLRLRHDLFAKISFLSCRQVDGFTVPSLISRLSSDTYNIHHAIGMMQRLAVRSVILLIGGVVCTLILDTALATSFLIIMPFLFCLIYFLSRRGIPLYGKVQKAVDAMVKKVREGFTGIRVMKALSRTEQEKSAFETVNQDLSAKERHAGIVMGIMNPLMTMFLNLGFVLVILIGAFRVQDGLTEPGKIIAFMTYFTLILNAMLSINRVFTMLSKAIASANRIEEILKTDADLPILPCEHVEEDAQIVFDNVTFSYRRDGSDQLKNISFSLKKGQTLGILGETGSGKSTLIQLLLRFYDADQGTIRINGDDIRSIPPQDLYTMFGVVFQNDFLMANTIGENVTFGREIEAEALDRALHDAQAWEFVSALEDGTDHMLVTKGANLSGGQRQRVLLARALASRPQILILDDASSALDYRTDAALRTAIRTNYDEITSIIVAQRVSSLKHADLILVLQNGEIAASGDHDSLYDSCELYREICQSQMGEVDERGTEA